MEVVEPGYQTPSRKTVQKRVEKRRDDLRKKMEDELKKCSSVALAADAWTSRAQESYLTVTAHFVNDSWEAQRMTLSTSPMDVNHTGEELANAIYDIAASYDVQEKTYGLLRDNASNMKTAAHILHSAYGIKGEVDCAAHTLQLCINNGLSLYQPILQTTSKVVSHFNHSYKASEALKQKQKLNNIPEQRLIQSCPTRWNSTYYMLSRLLEQRVSIECVLKDRSVTSLKERSRLEIKR